MQWHSVSAPYWDDKPVLIVGGGTSLAGFDFNRLRGLGHILAVKGSMFDIPFADAGFGLDLPRYREWQYRLADVPYPVYWAFPEEEETTRGLHIPDNVLPLRRVRGERVSDGPDYVYNGGTSGFGALNLAVLKKARQIVLFGFDFHAREDGDDWHYNQASYGRHRVQNAIRWREWAKRFGMIKADMTALGIEVLNASPTSKLPRFKRATLDGAIAALKAGGSLFDMGCIDPPEEEPPVPKVNKRGRKLEPMPGWVLR